MKFVRGRNVRTGSFRMSKNLLGNQKVGGEEDLGRQKSEGTKRHENCIKHCRNVISLYLILNFFIYKLRDWMTGVWGY